MKEWRPPISALKQMEAYAESAEADGCFYGNRKNFDKRHQVIKAWLKQAIDDAEKRHAARMEKK